jgi:hypothetical protein
MWYARDQSKGLAHQVWNWRIEIVLESHNQACFQGSSKLLVDSAAVGAYERNPRSGRIASSLPRSD